MSFETVYDNVYERCTLCPRECGVDRYKEKGFCGESAYVRIARAELHKWEEPCLSPNGRSGTVFFSGCNLGCCFCQNYEISSFHKGFKLTVSELAKTFLRLKDMGAENIDLVTPTHFVPSIIEALNLVKGRLELPVIYNCGGYEKPETLERLRGYVDVFLPDLKYFSPDLSDRFSHARNYFEYCSKSIQKMLDIARKPSYDKDGRLTSGVMVRHLVLPTCRHDSIALMNWLAESFDKDSILISLMSQFTPVFRSSEKGIGRRTTTFEYNSVVKIAENAGFDGFIQERSSAENSYIPDFYDQLYYDLSNTQNKV